MENNRTPTPVTSRTSTRILPMAAVLLALMGGIAIAQSFDAGWSVLPQSGGTSSNETHTMTSSVGQTATTEMTGKSHTLQSGFYPGLLVMTGETTPAPGEVWAIH
ncbi:MAG: hypothetical protein JJU11_04910 [Candidatus Sumerlaeia bacterium]|nr:hypothetical protein [Candidatus Sumerlaeia bacterium]